jgi:hypothetical protein
MDNKLLVIKNAISKDYILSYGFDTFNEQCITEPRFPITSKQVGVWEYKLFTFPQVALDTKEVIELIQAKGYKVAKIGHLLSFFKSGVYSSKQNNLFIALGSKTKFSGINFSPSFCKCYGKWDLNIGLHDLLWDKSRNYNFLAVRKIN